MKNKIVTIIVGLVLLVGGFFGGMKYGQGKGFSVQALASMSSDQRQQFLQQLRSGGGIGGNNFRRSGSTQGNAFASGQIISKDDKSITIKTQDGGSRIVFLSSSSQVSKSVSGAVTDLSAGENVIANGTSNSDGSMTAETIQIRP